MHTVLISAIVGSVVGIAGGLLGAYCSYKHARGPRERAFVVKAAVLLFGYIAAYLLICAAFARFHLFAWTVGIYAILLVWGIRAMNRRQSLIRAEESDDMA